LKTTLQALQSAAALFRQWWLGYLDETNDYWLVFEKPKPTRRS
jgi:hypothetical protein